MNAGYGNGLFLFKEAVAERVAPKTTGFNSLQGKYKPHEGTFIGRFEPGHQDTLNYGSLGKAIDVINDIGMQDIENRIQAIGTLAKEAFLERGLIDAAIASRADHASFFNITGDENLINTLASNDIISITRGNGVRVGFHYFNTEEDLAILLSVIDANV